ncbi:MAG: hypothetical protein KBT22_10470 [Bacteroidales bacterium]|nr:hypothetical protein [Candidatus Scybalocola fimicaballi]
MVKSFEELESVLANNGEVLTSIWKFKPRISVDQEKQEVIIYFGEDFVMDENIQNFRRELNGKFRPAYTSSKGEEFGQCFVFDNEVFARAFTGEDIADIKEGAIWSVKYSNFTESAIESESEISQEDVEPVQQNIIEEDIPESYEHRPINEIVPNEDEINSLKRRLGIGPYSDGDVTIISTAYLNEYAKSKGIRLFSFSERENEILRYCVKNFSEGITGLNRNNGAVKDILNSYFQTSLVNCPNYYTKKYNCLAQKYSQDYELAKDTIDDIKHENDNMEIDKYEFPYSNIVEKSEIQMWKDRFSQIGVPGASYSLEEDMALAKRFMTPSQYAVAIERDMMENFTSVAKGAREAFRNYFEGVSIDQEPSFSIYASKDVSVLSWDGEDFIRGVNQNGDWTGYSAEETFSLKEINPLGIREMLQESADFSQSINNDVVVNELKSLSETIIDKYKRGEISNTELIETRNMYREGGEEIVSLVCEQMTIDASRKESVEEIIDNLNSIISPADELIWHKLNGGLDDNTLIVISSCFNEAEIDILSEQLRDMKLIESKSNLKMSDESALQQIIEQGKILGETIVYKQLLEEPTVGKQFESVVLNYLNDEEKRQIIISALDEYSSEKFIREDKSVDYEGSIGLIKETMQKVDDSIKIVDYDVLPENIRKKRIEMDIQSLTVVNDIVCEYHKVKMLRCDYEKINRSFEIAESKYQNPVLAKNPVFQQIYEKAKIDKDNKIADINATVSSMKYFNQEKLDQNISEEQSESQSRGMRR